MSLTRFAGHVKIFFSALVLACFWFLCIPCQALAPRSDSSPFADGRFPEGFTLDFIKAVFSSGDQKSWQFLCDGYVAANRVPGAVQNWVIGQLLNRTSPNALKASFLLTERISHQALKKVLSSSGLEDVSDVDGEALLIRAQELSYEYLENFIMSKPGSSIERDVEEPLKRMVEEMLDSDLSSFSEAEARGLVPAFPDAALALLESREQSREMERVFRSCMSPRLQRIFREIYWEGRDASELAGEADVTVKRIMQLAAEARKKFFRALEMTQQAIPKKAEEQETKLRAYLFWDHRRAVEIQLPILLKSLEERFYLLDPARIRAIVDDMRIPYVHPEHSPEENLQICLSAYASAHPQDPIFDSTILELHGLFNIPLRDIALKAQDLDIVVVDGEIYGNSLFRYRRQAAQENLLSEALKYFVKNSPEGQAYPHTLNDLVKKYSLPRERVIFVLDQFSLEILDGDYPKHSVAAMPPRIRIHFWSRGGGGSVAAMRPRIQTPAPLGSIGWDAWRLDEGAVSLRDPERILIQIGNVVREIVNESPSWEVIADFLVYRGYSQYVHWPHFKDPFSAPVLKGILLSEGSELMRWYLVSYRPEMPKRGNLTRRSA